MNPLLKLLWDLSSIQCLKTVFVMPIFMKQSTLWFYKILVPTEKNCQNLRKMLVYYGLLGNHRQVQLNQLIIIDFKFKLFKLFQFRQITECISFTSSFTFKWRQCQFCEMNECRTANCDLTRNFINFFMATLKGAPGLHFMLIKKLVKSCRSTICPH